MLEITPFWSALFGALVGGLCAFAVQRWRFAVDRWQDRVDKFTGDILEVADLGTEFWLREGAGKRADHDIEQIKIRGKIERLESQRLAFIEWCSNKDYSIKVDRQFAVFNEKITGRTFSEKARKIDGNVAFEIQVEAAELVSQIAKSFAFEVSFRESLRRRFKYPHY